ncbi:uncharacterized protein LOC141589662 [Silene latifolia]|uniref:uncharacterized protein LOC141589662 n=1 Tax=Silene latifolia TaxID=37657 RepID=UPI003D772056
MERAALKKLEDAIHRMIIKKSEPDWLPLVPGGSYWVPPKSESRGFAQVVATLVKDSTSVTEFMRNDVSFGLNSNRGLPYSTQFFKGSSNSPLEEETNSKNSNQSEEDEEG